MNFIEAILLGLVQGLTEWLPISSSGHLVLIQHLLGLQAPLIFDILLHAGTLFAAIVFFRKDIYKFFIAAIKLDFKSREGQQIPYLIFGSLPIAVVGFLLHDIISSMFNSLFIVGLGLIFTGVLLYTTKNANSNIQLNFTNSLIIGLAQAATLLPGISRSGLTISIGRLQGVNSEEIFKFSFLLAIPSIIGANIFELWNIVSFQIEIFYVMVGTGIAAIVGYLSLRSLYRVLKKDKLYTFAYYCWIAGVITLLIHLTT
jgi:undecaprenyl-diphosphatase